MADCQGAAWVYGAHLEKAWKEDNGHVCIELELCLPGPQFRLVTETEALYSPLRTSEPSATWIWEFAVVFAARLVAIKDPMVGIRQATHRVYATERCEDCATSSHAGRARRGKGFRQVAGLPRIVARRMGARKPSVESTDAVRRLRWEDSCVCTRWAPGSQMSGARTSPVHVRVSEFPPIPLSY